MNSKQIRNSHKLLSIGCIIVAIIASLFFKFTLFAQNIDDYLMIQAIPAYPYSTDIKKSAVSDFLYEGIHGKMTFTTDDSAESVFTFYNNELPKYGWNLDESSNIPTYAHRKFANVVGGKSFTLDIFKSKNISKIDRQVRIQVEHHE